MISTVIAYVAGAVTVVVSQAAYNFVKKQVGSVESKAAPVVAKVEAAVKAKV